MSTQKPNFKKCRIIKFPTYTDKRGNLCVLQYNKYVPFKPKRTFWVWGTPTGTIRGGHAHKKSTQIHFCLNGKATITTHDGRKKQTFVLDSPSKGLLVEPMVWGEFKLSSPKACFIVVSSHNYTDKDYIKDFNKFLKLAKR